MLPLANPDTEGIIIPRPTNMVTFSKIFRTTKRIKEIMLIFQFGK